MGKRKKKVRRPSQIRVEATIGLGNRLKIKKQVESQTKYRLYRGDLSKLAQKRIWKIQQIRANYQKFLKKERKIAARQDDEDTEDNAVQSGNVEAEDLVEVD